MRSLGVGSRFSILTLALTMLEALMLGALLGACSSSEPGARSESAVLASESASADAKSGEPAQVVRQIKASPEPSAAAGLASAALAGEVVAGEAVPSEARASAAGVTRASGGLAPRSNAAETITSKHLEAELNRLEAELAN